MLIIDAKQWQMLLYFLGEERSRAGQARREGEAKAGVWISEIRKITDYGSPSS